MEEMDIQSYFLENIDPSYLKHTSYDKGSTIINEGDVLDQLIFVKEGKIKISQNYENGKTLLLQFIDGFTVLGDLEYYLKENAFSTVQAITDIKAVVIPYHDIDQHYQNNINFLKSILIQMGRKILQSNNDAQLNLIYPLETRLASYLLSLSINRKVTLPNLSDVANHLGTSYRHLNRVFNQFIKDNIIKKDYRSIIILDLKQLKIIGRGNIYERKNDIVVNG
jgi:CRP-like cAMP-binding protein